MSDLCQRGNGCLSVQVLQEFYVTVTQKAANPLAPQAAAEIIADLSVWQVHRLGVQDVPDVDAIRLQERYGTLFREGRGSQPRIMVRDGEGAGFSAAPR